jgi:iron complex outermembrane receptor protein
MTTRSIIRPAARHSIAALMLLIACGAATVGAQTVPVRGTRGASRDSVSRDSTRTRRDTAVLAPVVTTVLRTPLELARAPFAVAVTTRDEIQRARPGLALDEALRGVAGVQVDNRFNYALGERIAIRGFGARAQFGVRGVRVLVDGVPATMPDGQTNLNHVDLATLGRAEVIRGPASSMYGNAAGGVIQLESEAAPEAMIGGRVRTVSGSDGLLRLGATAGGQRDGAEYVLSGSRLRYDGYRAFNHATNDRVNARGSYGGAFGTARLSGSWVEYDAQNPGGLTDSLLRVDRTAAFPNNVRQQTGERGRQAQLGAGWSRTFGSTDIDAGAYGLTRTVDNPIPVRIVALDRQATGAHASANARGGVLGHAAHLALGVETQAQRDDRQNYLNALGARGALTLDQLEHVRSASAFSQAGVDVLPRLALLGGIRYDAFRFRVRDRFITPTDPDDSGERTLRAFSPSLGATLDIARPLTLYANYATAFETPTTTELANRPTGAGGFNPELQPQRTRSYEVGGKGRLSADWATGTWQLAAYRARVRDALVPFEVEGAPGRQFFRNAGSAIHRGVEAAMFVVLPAGFGVRGAYTYTDARFERYVVGTSVFDGNRVPGIAPHRGDVDLTYSGAHGFFADADARMSSSTTVDDANLARSPGYVVTGLRAGFERVRLAGAEISPFVGATNIGNVRYNTSVTINAAGRRYFEPGPGRSIYVGVDVGGALRGR